MHEICPSQQAMMERYFKDREEVNDAALQPNIVPAVLVYIQDVATIKMQFKSKRHIRLQDDEQSTVIS